jgi:hypothetical protein
MDINLTHSRVALLQGLGELRSRLEQAFSPETAQFGKQGTSLSAGQCAAVAFIVYELLGGELVSAKVEGESHWFNRLPYADGEVDVDLTADQFGHTPIRVSNPGQLYWGTRTRRDSEVAAETRDRAKLLKQRVAVDLRSIFATL